MNTTALRGLVLLAASSCLGGARASDSILMKDNSVLEGEVVVNQADAPEIVVNVGGRKLPIARATVRQISLDQPSRDEYQRRAAALKPADGKGHYELAQWCKQRRLYGREETELKATLAADPGHAEARKALGLAAEAAPAQAAASAGKPAESVVFIATASPPATQADALTRKVRQSATTLAQTGAPEEARQEAIRTLLQERDKAGDVLLGCLDFRKFPEAELRRGALKGILVVKPSGLRVSPALAWSAVTDPDENVRADAVDVIKQTKDSRAVGIMLRHLVEAFDEQGNVVDAPVRDAAVSALRSVNDARVAEALLYYCTMELRPAMTELDGPIEILYMRVLSFFDTGIFRVAYTVILPIQFPNLKIVRVRTTVCAPAAALRALTGQDFGDDSKAWLNWIRNH